MVLNGDPSVLLTDPEQRNHQLRRPGVDRPYFWAFTEIADKLRGLFDPGFSWSAFFASEKDGLPSEQIAYLNALLKNAKGTPVLKFCRSAGRMRAMRAYFPGVHVYLWREPRGQWWSDKTSGCFDLMGQRVYGAAKLPAVLCAVREQWGIDGIRPRSLRAWANYGAFYGLWLFSWLEARHHMDMNVCIDGLAMIEGYRSDVMRQLAERGVCNVDLGSCRMVSDEWTPEEDGFYSWIEAGVVDTFVSHGYAREDVQEAIALSGQIRAMRVSEHPSSRAQALRQGAMRLMDALAQTSGERDALRKRLPEARCGHPDQGFGGATYAQFGEDIVVVNIFHRMGIEKPSYIDIGAHHPINVSNTALLYMRGSRGINIEANPNLMKNFYEMRPDDINLNVGVSKEPGVLKLYMIDQFSGRNSFSKQIADDFVAKNPSFSITAVKEIPTENFNAIIDRHANGACPDFLTIDAEGLDFEILESIDFVRYRPKVICVEVATGGDIDSSVQIARLLESNSYYVHFRTPGNLIFVLNEYKSLLH